MTMRDNEGQFETGFHFKATELHCGDTVGSVLAVDYGTWQHGHDNMDMAMMEVDTVGKALFQVLVSSEGLNVRNSQKVQKGLCLGFAGFGLGSMNGGYC